jgi:hypothetical protein
MYDTCPRTIRPPLSVGRVPLVAWQQDAIFGITMSEKSKKTYGTFSDDGSIYLVDVLIPTYNILISFRSGL